MRNNKDKIISIEVLRGIPASGKSTYAKELLAKYPGIWKRANNDDLRSAIDDGKYSADNEKMIRRIRSMMLKEFVKSGYNVVYDNVHATSDAFNECVKIAKESGKNVCVTEKCFYIPLEEAIERDSKRIGKAKVGEAVVRKFWKALGGESFKGYTPRIELITASDPLNSIRNVQNPNLPKALICDNDGTLSLLNGRNPYDASTCDQDLPNHHVIECMKLYFNAGYKIIFVSGREEKDRAPTERFYAKHFPEVTYELYMRPTGNQDKDVVIKENIYNTYIKDRFYVSAWLDDRLSVSKWIHDNNLNLLRVGDPTSSF